MPSVTRVNKIAPLEGRMARRVHDAER